MAKKKFQLCELRYKTIPLKDRGNVVGFRNIEEGISRLEFESHCVKDFISDLKKYPEPFLSSCIVTVDGKREGETALDFLKSNKPPFAI